MFEKDAEKYGKENCVIQKNGLCTFVDSERTSKIWKDGAEYGYDKANEWHYVKDGDLPKENQKCYFIYSNVYGEDNKVIFSESDINVLTGIYTFFLDEETGEETTDPCFYDDINNDEIDLKEVYAWKEIILPEFPKESK
jgi:hypothetical protein